MKLRFKQRLRRLRRRIRNRPAISAVVGTAIVLALLGGFSLMNALNEPIVEGARKAGPTSSADSVPDEPLPGLDSLTGPAGASGFAGLGPAPLGGPCTSQSVTLSVTSDTPIAIGGYLTSSGDQEYFDNAAQVSVTLELCGQRPVAVVIAQAAANATTITCTTTVDGQQAETRTERGPSAAVYCYA